MKHILFYFSAIVILFGIASCDLGEDQPERNLYEFNQPVSISPSKAEYFVGDILIMEVIVPQKAFQDLKTGENISVGNATFALNARMNILQVEPIPEDSILFDLILQSGEADESSDFDLSGEVSIKYGCPENDYFLQFGYQLKSKGNFLLTLNDLNLQSLIIFNEDSDCSLQTTFPPPDDADQAFVNYFFEGPNVNLEVFKEMANNSNDPNYDYYQSLLENRSAFFLKVR